MQDVFIHPSGQDDNLGDSALRVGLLRALRGDGRRLHLLLEEQSTDYLAALPLDGDSVLYPARKAWVESMEKTRGAVLVLNAGEVNPQPGLPFPPPARVAEARVVLSRGGVVVAAGIGFKDPASAGEVRYDRVLRDAAVVSWRDDPSRAAAGVGAVAPDWGFALGSDPSQWARADDRELVAVTLRFDRPWPGDQWLGMVRRFAAQTSTRIVTVAQVARDAPRAVQLARALGGEYLVAPSTAHDDLDVHVRSVYARSVAVVSDRAHALIIGATEGAYPVGSAADAQKIRRLLDVVGLGEMTGVHDELAERVGIFGAVLPGLAGAVASGRRDLAALAERIRHAMGEIVKQ
ncbi:polysaccharide pyruvyl transferase family protein [Microbacterium sp. RD1]|uniref:polysaccharide pyruvyl transferase family protein n=1 Tax=Microbacterium sp. RD1 TaxID=3457313 RepID=UPI003FA5B4D4